MDQIMGVSEEGKENSDAEPGDKKGRGRIREEDGYDDQIEAILRNAMDDGF